MSTHIHMSSTHYHRFAWLTRLSIGTIMHCTNISSWPNKTLFTNSDIQENVCILQTACYLMQILTIKWLQGCICVHPCPAASALSLVPDITDDPQCPDELTFTCSGAGLSLNFFRWSRDGTTLFLLLPGSPPSDTSPSNIEITLVCSKLNGTGTHIEAVESTLMVSDASLLDGSEICCGDTESQECETVTVRGMYHHDFMCILSWSACT